MGNQTVMEFINIRMEARLSRSFSSRRSPRLHKEITSTGKTLKTGSVALLDSTQELTIVIITLCSSRLVLPIGAWLVATTSLQLLQAGLIQATKCPAKTRFKMVSFIGVALKNNINSFLQDITRTIEIIQGLTTLMVVPQIAAAVILLVSSVRHSKLRENLPYLAIETHLVCHTVKMKTKIKMMNVNKILRILEIEQLPVG